MIPRRLHNGDKFTVLLTLWNQLIEHLHSLRPVAGRGMKVSSSPTGTIIEALYVPRGGSGFSAGASVGGSFIVELIAEENGEETSYSLAVGEGFANVNGKVFQIARQEDITIESGLLCLTVDIDTENGAIKDPEVKFAQFNEKNYPIAEITQDENGNWAIKQYPVAVAVFMLVKMCAFAKAASNGGK